MPSFVWTGSFYPAAADKISPHHMRQLLWISPHTQLCTLAPVRRLRKQPSCRERKSPSQCLDCRGPHKSRDPKCAAHPTRRNGALVRPTKQQLQAIRANGGAAWRISHPTQTSPLLQPIKSQTPPSTVLRQWPGTTLLFLFCSHEKKPKFSLQILEHTHFSS